MVTYTLGQHELARAMAAHVHAKRARQELEALSEALGKDLDPELQSMADLQLMGLRSVEKRALRLRKNAELKHAPQADLL